MNILIRPAQVNDATAICAVVRNSIEHCCQLDHKNDPALLAGWLANKTVENTERWLNNTQNIALVAQVGAEVQGFAMAKQDELMLLYATPQVRYQGVGKALLQAIEEKLKAANVTLLRLESTLTAQDFYQRNGFQTTGELDLSFGIPAQAMSKSI